MFQQPVTGDQTLIVDGTTIPDPIPPAPLRKFSRTAVSISIGLSQSNVLQRPIYLDAIPMDGTATQFDVASGNSSITSARAPGVELDIPAGIAQFPDGNTSGLISMNTISAEFSTIAPLEIAQPKHVVTLEPSGMIFSEPVQLTLPNVDELPPGVEVVILSMNSKKGIWSVDGAAKVSDDGQSVVTKPGMGITHFSVVYAAPISPTVRQIGAQDKPGANAFDGALTTSIKLPSYKSLGQDIAPSLIYRSSWAKPTVLVTNMFDIPEKEILLDTSFLLVRSVKTCFLILCGETLYYDKVTTQATAWYQPEKVVAQFFSENVISQPMTFTGMPNRAAISFALDLKDTDGNYVSSGIYAYDSHYEVHLKETIVTTRKVKSWSTAQQPVVTQDIEPETQELNRVYPQDLGGTILIQNKIQSEAGRGWAIAGAQKIVNPTANRLMIEETDGSTATYALDNTIQTLFDAGAVGYDVSRAADVSQWPYVYYLQSGTSNFNRTDLSKVNPTVDQFMGSTPNWSGQVSGMNSFERFFNVYFCGILHHFYTYTASDPQAILPFPDGSIQATDSNRSVIFKYDYPISGSSVGTRIAGLTTSPPQFEFHDIQSNHTAAVNNWCSIQPGLSCVPNFGVENLINGPRLGDPNVVCFGTPTLPKFSAGDIPDAGFNGDGVPPTGIQLNRPLGIAAGPRPNTAVVADTGNNRVRLIDYSANTVITIAGNGTTFDNGDGNMATDAGMFHPRGVIYDSVGNLYITTENGFIRKVDLTGSISTFAGNANGTVGDSLPASQVILRRPFGMTIDNNNGYLYVAEQDSHLVRRIDFQTKTALTVAGSGVPGFNGDGIPALNASLFSPKFLGLDDQGNLLIVDSGNQKIRRVIFQNSGTGILAYKPTANDHSTLVRNTDGSFTRSFRNGNQVLFDAQGKQMASVDRVGRQTTFQYDGQGRLTRIIDPANRGIQYTYSGAYLSSITDPANRTTFFNYDVSGNLIQVTYPNGATKTFIYDPSGLMLSETNERGIATDYSYNEWNRLASVKRADGSEITINDSSSATAANNFTGGNVGTLKPIGTGSNQVFDGIKDAKSLETKFVKDFQGYLTTVINALGQVTSIKRDIKGQPTLITRPDGTTVSFVYDPATDDLISQTDSAENITTSQTYNSFGNLLTQTNGRGFTSRNQYHLSNGLLLSRTDPLNHSVTYQYNNALKLVSHVTNALGKSTVSQYDSAGNLISETNSLNQVTTYTRDLAGNVISARNSQGQVTQYEYDAFNRLTAVTTPKNERTEYLYLTSGELSQIKDPKNNVTTFEYDDLGRMIRKTDTLGFVIARQYDANGNIIREVDPNGNVKTFEYDSLNQLVRKTLPDNVYNLAYDVRGNLIQAKNSHSQMDFEYDSAGRIQFYETRGLGSLSGLPQVSLTFDYDGNGNRTLMNDPVGQTSYQYNAADRLTSLRNPKGENYDFTYDVANRLTSLSRPGSNSTFSFDDGNLLSSIVHSSSFGNIASFNYQRNNIGNITQIAGLQATRNFSYDDNQQLVLASNPEASDSSSYQNESFSYDSVYNRTQDQGGNYSYDQKSQRLIEDYKYLYLYDNNGNLITKTDKNINGDVINYSYTSENQLVAFRVYVPGNLNLAKEVFYVYDAFGRRVQKQVVDHLDNSKSFTRRYLYDGQEILFEYDGSNNIVARYTHSSLQTDDVLSIDVTSNGVTAGVAQSSGSYQYIKDRQGTVTDIADINGNKLQHYVYSAFGILLGIKDASANDVSANPPLRTTYTYTGRELDKESGFYYYRARNYDPVTGRFVQRDPHPGKLEIPGTVFNSYAYVLSNPVNFTDPSGKFIPALIAGIAALGSLIAGGVGVGSALLAVGSVLGGSIVAAAIQSAVTGKWGADFWNNVATNFTIGAGLLAIGGLIGIVSGGSLVAGGNGIHGYVHTTKSFLLGADKLYQALTLGSAHFGQGAFSSTLLAHEFGHTLQFLALNALPIGSGGVWGAYLGFGALGLSPLGTWWEANGSFLGGANTCINCNRYGLLSAAY
jgi:RHS repeat-associated protein